MSYYMGDYYRGDYYRGDPGFFSFLGGIGKSILGLGKGAPKTQVVSQAITKLPMAARGAISRVQGVVRGHPILSAAAGAGSAAAAGMGIERAVAGKMAPGAKGFHMSRKTGKMVRNRHMRVTNVHALRRSLRRIHGFSRIAKKVLHITHPPRHARTRFVFKRRKRAA